MPRERQSIGFRPDWRVPPGEIISEALIERNMSRKQLGREASLEMTYVRGLMSGEAAITPDIADRLEKVLGVSAAFWLKAEAHYRRPRL